MSKLYENSQKKFIEQRQKLLNNLGLTVTRSDNQVFKQN